ncbi:serine/threonine-protein phosphatase 6 regulatory subunit 3 isoform X2 [Leptopilina heterotoma]|uniref:serine/threonine-protein phosphatase 6 regulatory subunit 3 isoform X2 n=1 Tax=Leptopilina heterotoma TaxID=63436 RepID=UPI001CA98691|nr:serine/threonine-protein phosphatase 6 regulatory subunit 3 isoform X2 [Leptopilina heterotoma]
MFWASAYVSSPQVEALLSKQDFTLYELMDIDDILQECKSQNKKLIEFITRPDIMKELVTLTTKEPPLELEERRRYKYPNVACELLTCDLPTVNEKLAGDEDLLSKLYSFIDTEEPLNPLLASFFSRTIGVLVSRATDQNWYSYQFTCLQFLEFLKSRQRCVELLLHHLETSAIMDLLLKLVTQVEGSDMRQNILTWLDGQQLVQRLIGILSPESGSKKHSNASQLICDMITEGREYKHNLTERAEPDPILQRLESVETVELILKTILTGEKVESSIIGGIQILMTLLTQKTKCNSSEAERGGNGSDDLVSNEQCQAIINATIPFLEELNKLLLEPPYKPPVNTTVGVLEVPLGNTRIHVIKLFVALLSTEKSIDKSISTSPTIERLIDLGTFQILLDLFFKYSFNNFLHTQVQQFYQVAIDWNSPDINEHILENIFIKCKLLERIMECCKKNEEKKSEKPSVKEAYMGHLIELANHVVEQCEKNRAFNDFFLYKLPEETLDQWVNFVAEHLGEINKIQQIMLGGPAQVYMSKSAEKSDVYAYSQEVYAQQEQLLGSHYVSYAVHDEKFIDGDEDLHSNTVGQLGTIDFILNDDDLSKGEEMFSKLCFEKRINFGEDNEEVNWSYGNDLTFQTVLDKDDASSPKKSHDSSSSEEDEGPCDMEIDSNDASALPPVNPWDVPSSEPVEETGWANFDNFDLKLSIDSETNAEPFVATFPDIVPTPITNLEEETVYVQKISLEGNFNDSNASGDEMTNSTETNLLQKENLIEKKAPITTTTTTTCLDSVNTPDSNANPITNPVTINTLSTTTDVKKDTNDVIQNTIENVKPLEEQSTTDVVENSPADDLVL